MIAWLLPVKTDVPTTSRRDRRRRRVHGRRAGAPDPRAPEARARVRAARERAGQKLEQAVPSTAGIARARRSRARDVRSERARRARASAATWCSWVCRTRPARRAAEAFSRPGSWSSIYRRRSASKKPRATSPGTGITTRPRCRASAVYGLPELHRARARGGASSSRRPVATSTSALLALSPLLRASGLVERDGIVVDTKTGVSGAGRAVGAPSQFSETAEGARPYKIAGSHRHTPEIEQELSLVAGAPVRVLLTPHLVPMTRGLLATCYARARAGTTAEACREAARELYREGLVTVLEEGLASRYALRAGLGARPRGVRARCAHRLRRWRCARSTTFARGASAEAIQALNVSRGWPDALASPKSGLFPVTEHRLRLAPRPGHEERMASSHARSRFSSFRTSCRVAISRAPSRRCAAALDRTRALPGAARHHRLGQDLHHRQRHPARPEADADHRAQQDARRAALRRDAASSSRTTRSSTSSATTTTTSPRRTSRRRDTYIEKDAIINDADRSHAPRGDARAPLAPRRHHRRLGELHLRHRLGRELPRPAHRAREGRGVPARRAAPAAGRHPVRAQRHRLPPRHVPRARRRRRGLPGLRGGDARSASSSSATRSRPSTRSIRCAARCMGELDRYAIFPGSHYVTPQQQLRTRHRARSATSCASGSTSTTRQGASSRSSASSSARCTTSR